MNRVVKLRDEHSCVELRQWLGSEILKVCNETDCDGMDMSRGKDDSDRVNNVYLSLRRPDEYDRPKKTWRESCG